MTDDRTFLRSRGWTDRDIDEFVRRRGDRWLRALPPLPPVFGDEGSCVEAAVLRRVRALLAKAESTPFAEEAEAFSAKAQELMARHRIVHLEAEVGGPGGRRIWLDPPYEKAKAGLAMRVARANGCRAVHLGVGCVHVVGFPDDAGGLSRPGASSE